LPGANLKTAFGDHLSLLGGRFETGAIQIMLEGARLLDDADAVLAQLRDLEPPDFMLVRMTARTAFYHFERFATSPQ
jgi:hypothetical protein